MTTPKCVFTCYAFRFHSISIFCRNQRRWLTKTRLFLIFDWYLLAFIMAHWIIDHVQVLLTRLRIHCAEIKNHMIFCVPSENSQHLQNANRNQLDVSLELHRFQRKIVKTEFTFARLKTSAKNGEQDVNAKTEKKTSKAQIHSTINFHLRSLNAISAISSILFMTVWSSLKRMWKSCSPFFRRCLFCVWLGSCYFLSVIVVLLVSRHSIRLADYDLLKRKTTLWSVKVTNCKW